jgi:putative drug exporter of the RND superfamily
MTGPLYRLGQFCARHKGPVLLAWIALVIAVVVAARSAGQETSDNLTLPGTGSEAATDLLEAKFPSEANGSVPIAFRAPPGDKVTDQKYQQPIEQVTKRYANDPMVEQAVSPLSSQGKGQVNKAQTIGFISLTLKESQSELSVDEAERLVDLDEPLEAAGLETGRAATSGRRSPSPPPTSRRWSGSSPRW